MLTDPTPPWSSFASDVLGRLHETWHIHSWERPRVEAFTAPVVLPGVALSALQRKRGADCALGGTALDEIALPPVPLHVVQLCLRFAAHFGTADGFQQCLQSGQITLISGIAQDQLSYLRELICVGFAPENLKIGFAAPPNTQSAISWCSSRMTAWHHLPRRRSIDA